MLPGFFQSSGQASESLPPPTSLSRKCKRPGFRKNQKGEAQQELKIKASRAYRSLKGSFPSSQPMHRVPNTCPGNSQHACDPRNWGSWGSSPWAPGSSPVCTPWSRGPEELLLCVAQRRLSSGAPPGSSGRRVGPVHRVSPTCSWNGWRGGEMSQTGTFPLGCLLSPD